MAAKKSGKKSGKKAGKKSGKKAGKKKKRGRTGPGSPLSVDSEGGAFSGVEDTVPTYSSTVSHDQNTGEEGKSSSPLLLIGLGAAVAIVLVLFLFKGRLLNTEKAPEPTPQGVEQAAPETEYAVKANETFESIARDRLHDKARAQEILNLNIEKFAKIEGRPGNEGLTAQKLKDVRLDAPLKRDRKFLLPSK